MTGDLLIISSTFVLGLRLRCAHRPSWASISSTKSMFSNMRLGGNYDIKYYTDFQHWTPSPSQWGQQEQYWGCLLAIADDILFFNTVPQCFVVVIWQATASIVSQIGKECIGVRCQCCYQHRHIDTMSVYSGLLISYLTTWCVHDKHIIQVCENVAKLICFFFIVCMCFVMSWFIVILQNIP